MNILEVFLKNKRIFVSLVINEFKKKYFGNKLGIAWAFLQPLATIFVLWFVFQVGFKAVPIDNMPFILWLATGMIPWFYFSDTLSSGTLSILTNGFLVKKIVFNVELLPLISIFSNLIVHVFFILFLLLIYIFYGYYPSVYWIQIPYYVFSSIILLIGLTWITSSVVLFFRDLAQIVNILMQFGFWLTPVFWNLSMVPEKYLPIIKINPLIYLINGFRGIFIYHKWFWEDLYSFSYFWLFTCAVCYFGNKVFARLRPHFADVV